MCKCRSGSTAAAGANCNQTQPDNVLTALQWDLAATACRIPKVCIALRAAYNAALIEFPRITKLLDILQNMVHSNPTFHGIVFVRQRQGVFAVANMLHTLPQFVNGVHLHTYTGHSAKTRSQLAREGDDHNSAGMPTNKQQEAIDKFQQGTAQEIMVATAALQEGLDVVNCSFVVCYNVTESGVQLMQWRGRTRKFDSEIHVLVEAGSKDEALLGKAFAEERNDHLAQITLST